MHDDLAPHYDELFDDLYDVSFICATHALLEILENLRAPPARVLDVGAGTGRIALPLVEAGYAVTAVEPSRGMRERLIEKAADERRHIELRAGVVPDALLPTDLGFDLALLAFGVIDYIVDDAAAEAALRAIAARMSPDGLCVVQPAPKHFMRSGVELGTHYRREVEVRWTGDVAAVKHRVLKDEQQVAVEDLQMRYRSPDALRPLVARAGWQVREEKTDGLYPTWVLELAPVAAPRGIAAVP